MARIVPYQVDAMLEALPKRLVGPVEPPVQQVQSLARLAQLPDKLSERPPAAALPGEKAAARGRWRGSMRRARGVRRTHSR